MEYPMLTLITGHRSLKSLVSVTVHEFVHSWYQMILATNESYLYWMDEGFNTYYSRQAVNYLFNNNNSSQNLYNSAMLGRIQSARGDLASAEKTLRRATAAAPTESALYHYLGGILMRRGQRGEALDALRKAVALAPDEGIIQAELGVLLSDLDRHEEAVAILERAKSNKTVSAELLYALVVSRLAIGDVEAAKLARLELELLYANSPLVEKAQHLGK